MLINNIFILSGSGHHFFCGGLLRHLKKRGWLGQELLNYWRLKLKRTVGSENKGSGQIFGLIICDLAAARSFLLVLAANQQDIATKCCCGCQSLLSYLKIFNLNKMKCIQRRNYKSLFFVRLSSAAYDKTYTNVCKVLFQNYLFITL